MVDKNQAMLEWLTWLTRVRLLFIVLILAVGVVWPQYFPTSEAYRLFLPIIVLWITFGILELILVRWMPHATWQGGIHLACDAVMVTGVVAPVTITNPESANDRVTVNGLGGNDTISGSVGLAALIQLTLDGGDGNDTLNGGANQDTCRGQTGRDTAAACEVRTGIP